MWLHMPKNQGIILLTPTNYVIVSYNLVFNITRCLIVCRVNKMVTFISRLYELRQGCHTYQSTCFRGSRKAFLFSKLVRPGRYGPFGNWSHFCDKPSIHGWDRVTLLYWRTKTSVLLLIQTSLLFMSIPTSLTIDALYFITIKTNPK